MVQASSVKSRRIAINTVILFIRMFVVMLVNLYAVRIVLDRLGITDYGIFNAIAGIVTCTSFISSVMEMSIQRFYAIAIGEKNSKKFNEIFCLSAAIIAAIIILTLIIIETSGLWLLRTQFTIPPLRYDAALWCFHLSLATFSFTILQIPFSAAVFAYEKLNVYALISTVDCLLKLLAGLTIGFLIIDNLIYYSAGVMLTSIFVCLSYIIYSRRKFTECRIRKCCNIPLLKELLSFAGWTLWGCLAKVGTFQGNTILLNIFFGPIINAAFAIAMQISNAFNALCNSMVLAIRPSMIKTYAANDFSNLNKLFNVSNKFILYTLLIISFPIISEIDTILAMWLPNVTAEMNVFAKLIIIYIVCLAMNNPITIIIQAAGKVKQYFVPVELVSMLCLPVTLILFKLGMSANWALISMIITCLIAHGVRLICLRRYYYPFSIIHYIRSLLLPSIAILIIGIIIMQILKEYTHGVTNHIAGFLVLPIFVSMLVFWIGLSKSDRNIIFQQIKNVYKKWM